MKIFSKDKNGEYRLSFIQALIFVVLFFVMLLAENKWLVWSSSLVIFVVGIINLWNMIKLNRNTKSQ